MVELWSGGVEFRKFAMLEFGKKTKFVVGRQFGTTTERGAE